uniref:Methyltransferase FkbM domain-containing protein n=1 Tax=viral metagenome TaxID=1070528 RepID=A0A6C0E015_9ZZZZ
MLSNDLKYQEAVKKNMYDSYYRDVLPVNHQLFLEKLKNEYFFTPKVCYDVGSSVLHWTRHVERIWDNVEVILFDGFSPYERLYKGYKYNIGVLSDKDNKIVKFYQNDFFFGGNSYYREIGYDNGSVFPVENYLEKETRTLDSIVIEKQFPYPDLIKIDVQGAELDILKGATNVLKHVKYLIVELQNVEYNEGAPLCDTTISYLKSVGFNCIAEKFSNNGPDGDYCFINTNL